MESEKQVTFSPEVTLRVYEPQVKPQVKSPVKLNSSPLKFSSVKSRLGNGSLGIVRRPSMKPSPPVRLNKMKSDMMRKESIHSRLAHTSSQKSVFKRLGE